MIRNVKVNAAGDLVVVDDNGQETKFGVVTEAEVDTKITTHEAQQAHIVDPTDLATCLTAVASILDALEAAGHLASA